MWGEGMVEVHLESHGLRADAMKGGGIVVASTNVETVVAASIGSNTLKKNSGEKQ